MTKGDFVELVAERTGQSKAAALESVDAVTGAICDVLGNGDEIRFIDLGTFKVRQQAARDIKVFGEPTHVPAKGVVKFTASTALKNRVA